MRLLMRSRISSGILQTLIIHVVVSPGHRRLPPVGGCPAKLIGVPSSQKRLTTAIGFVRTYRPQFAETPSNRVAKKQVRLISGVSLAVNLFTAIRQAAQQLHVCLCGSRSALRHTKVPHQRLPRQRAVQAVKCRIDCAAQKVVVARSCSLFEPDKRGFVIA